MTSSHGASFKGRGIRDDRHRNEESVRDCLHDESRVRGSNGDRAKRNITREERQTVESLSITWNASQGLFFGGSPAALSNEKQRDQKERRGTRQNKERLDKQGHEEQEEQQKKSQE